MKKTFAALTLALVVALALYSGNAQAWGWGQNGMMGSFGPVYNSADFQAFMTETASLRIEIAADRAELRALMTNSQPDPKRVRELTERISANEIKLAEKARSYNVNSMTPGGPDFGMMSGMMGHGYGFTHCW